LENGKIKELWTFDSDAVGGRGAAMGNHNLAVADVDNDGCDEIIAGSLTLDNDGKILYVMDGQMNREEGSHGDAIHIGQFYPDVEGLFVWEPREIDRVASLELHDAATGETKMRFFANRDAGRAMAANVTSKPGYEVWGTGGKKPNVGGGVYNVYDGSEKPVVDSYANAKMSYNFKLYWDGDLLHELLDGLDKAPLSISKFNEEKSEMEVVKTLDGCHSNNGTKANPSLQADILGDWREEVIVPTDDDTQLRIYSTTVPSEYRIYCLMQDPVYRSSVAWQNNGYNQPTCLGFYLGADNASVVKDGRLPVPKINYVNK
jgi:rhamnogalacturonan endolyase